MRGFPRTWSDVLRDAIRQSKKTPYEIAKKSGVDQMVISRFLSGERDVRLATADKLVSAIQFNQFRWVLHLVDFAKDRPDFAILTAWAGVENSVGVGIQRAMASKRLPKAGTSIDDSLDLLVEGQWISKRTAKSIRKLRDDHQRVVGDPNSIDEEGAKSYLVSAYEAIQSLWGGECDLRD